VLVDIRIMGMARRRRRRRRSRPRINEALGIFYWRKGRSERPAGGPSEAVEGGSEGAGTAGGWRFAYWALRCRALISRSA
jgi:hypothetical protein